MKKRFFAKLTAAAIAAAQVATGTVFAAVTTGGGENTEYGYYWYENFNDYTTGTTAPTSVTIPSTQTNITSASYEVKTDENYAYKVGNKATSNTSSNHFKIVGDKPLDFSKGPIVISYDITPTATSTKIRGELIDNVNSGILAQFAYFNNSKIQGYKLNSDGSGLTAANSKIDITANTKYTVSSVFNYDPATKQLYCKQYVNGAEMVDLSGNAFEYTRTLSDTVASRLESNTWSFRFYVYGGSTAIMDNVCVFTEGQPNLPDAIGWVKNGQGTGVTYSNDVSYGSGVSIPCAYQFPYTGVKNSSQYELKKYDISSDPLMLNGVDAASTIAWSGGNGFTVSGLDVTNKTSDCYVMKLNDVGIIKNYSGVKNTNQYLLLHGGVTTAPIIRESRILDAYGNAMALESGKLPVTAKTLEFTVANSKAETLDAANVKIEGNGSSKASKKDGSVYTIALGTLAEGTDYTVTVGDTVQTLTTTGERSKMNAAIERFDDSSVVKGMYISDSDCITVTHDADKGVLWKSSFPTNGANSYLKYATYAFDDAFDFTKGDMLVSFDVELNQNIAWISDTASYQFNPMLIFGKSTVYMPYIYALGIRARSSSGGPKTITDGNATMSKGDKCTVSVLCHYNAETKQLEYTQFVDGKRLMSDATTEIPVNTVGIADEYLEAAPQIRFAGRGFGDGGVYIDNVKITTIDGMTADRLLTITNSTATIDLKSTVAFPEGTDKELTEPQYVNTLTKSDIIVTKYDNTDTLLANGTVVTDFTFDSASMTIGNLDSAYTYVIKLSDTSKLASINGSPIKVDAFKAAASPSGLVESVIYDSNNYQIYADKDGKWPSNAAKIKLVFAGEHSSVKIGDTEGVSDGNGGYVFDYSSNALQANIQYTVTVDGNAYGKFTTSDGSVSVSKPVIGADGKASVTVTNTTSTDKSVYIIHAAYKDNDELSDIRYEKIDVSAGDSASYTMTASPSLDGAVVQKVFVWDGFAEMTPYCEATVSKISN